MVDWQEEITRVVGRLENQLRQAFHSTNLNGVSNVEMDISITIKPIRPVDQIEITVNIVDEIPNLPTKE